MWELLDYLTEDGRGPFAEWLSDLADRRDKVLLFHHLRNVSAGQT